MNRLLILFLLTFNTVYAQQFNFNSHISEALDKWVVFDRNDTDSTYAFGFIYVDLEAGFTFNYESRLLFQNGKLEKLPNNEFNNIKYRLEANTKNVHILSDDEIKQLELPKEPHWLEIYKSNNTGISYLKNMGRHYNHIGAIEKSTPLLEKAYLENPHYEGLEFELAFAYNAAKNFDKAIDVLVKAIANNKDNFWFYRELGFSYLQNNKLEEAEDTYRKGIGLSKNSEQNAEMAINMTQAFFRSKNRDKFDEWAKITRDFIPKGSQFDQFIEYFINNWGQQ